jgi:hypothetical protein
LVAQDLADVPFDLRHLRVLHYAYNPRGMADFEKALEQTILGILNTSGEGAARDEGAEPAE